MKTKNLSLPAQGGTVSIPTAEIKPDRTQSQSVATRDHDIIRAWAAGHSAEPATGEATTSGPATIDVNDGGVGIRFNFPGVGRFRPISWAEWFEHFDRNRLVFVHEEEVADRAYALWQRRGGEHGRDREDWFEAERQLQGNLSRPVVRYWFVQLDADATEE